MIPGGEEVETVPFGAHAVLEVAHPDPGAGLQLSG